MKRSRVLWLVVATTVVLVAAFLISTQFRSVPDLTDVETLVAILTGKGDSRNSADSGVTRNECIYRLGVLRDAKAIPILTSIAMDKEESLHDRTSAAMALGRIGDPASLPVIEALLKDAPQGSACSRHLTDVVNAFGDRHAPPESSE
jgi:HEAT repeat protein